MRTKQYSAGIILSAAIAVAALGGCCSGRHDHCGHHSDYPAYSFGCFGYHSTCWRPWPEECPTCPSFAILPPPQETVLKDVPFNQHEMLPPGIDPLPAKEPVPPPEEPVPAPEEPLPPVIEPQEGSTRPRVRARNAAARRAPQAPTEHR